MVFILVSPRAIVVSSPPPLPLRFFSSSDCFLHLQALKQGHAAHVPWLRPSSRPHPHIGISTEYDRRRRAPAIRCPCLDSSIMGLEIHCEATLLGEEMTVARGITTKVESRRGEMDRHRSQVDQASGIVPGGAHDQQLQRQTWRRWRARTEEPDRASWSDSVSYSPRSGLVHTPHTPNRSQPAPPSLNVLGPLLGTPSRAGSSVDPGVAGHAVSLIQGCPSPAAWMVPCIN